MENSTVGSAFTAFGEANNDPPYYSPVTKPCTTSGTASVLHEIGKSPKVSHSQHSGVRPENDASDEDTSPPLKDSQSQDDDVEDKEEIQGLAKTTHSLSQRRNCRWSPAGPLKLGRLSCSIVGDTYKLLYIKKVFVDTYSFMLLHIWQRNAPRQEANY